MNANPQQFGPQEVRRRISELRPKGPPPTLGRRMLRFFQLLHLATWRAFKHDQFTVTKASTYSSILTFFPALLVVDSVLATLSRGDVYLREISYALKRILPA